MEKPIRASGLEGYGIFRQAGPRERRFLHAAQAIFDNIAVKACERWWLDQIASLGCAACYREGTETPAGIHHIRSWAGTPAGLSKRGHGEFLVLPLCHFHHQGKLSIHASPEEFKRLFGSEVDLFNETLQRLARQMMEK